MQLVDAGSSRTDWALIAEAGTVDEQASARALEGLVRRYWPAVYAYIRGTGHDVHEAADLTQDFICDIIITRNLCAGADPDRGRFRTLLLSSLKNYLRQRHRREQRRWRLNPHRSPLSLAEPEELMAGMPRAGGPQTPDAAFSYQWSATLVRRVLEEVQKACRRDGLDAHWSVFEQRVIRPLFLGEPATDYAELVSRLGLKDASQAANMMVTVKRRFVRTLRAEVGRTLANPAEIEDELGELLRDLERPS